jgi:hypothetical protein
MAMNLRGKRRMGKKGGAESERGSGGKGKGKGRGKGRREARRVFESP